MIYLNKECKEPLYMQIYTQIKEAIMAGSLKKGQVLTGSRGLAKTLQVSRNTVDNAYGQLLAEGYISPKKGIGYIVAEIPELRLPHLKPANFLNTPVRREEAGNQGNIVYDLTNSSHTSNLFPKTLWRKYTLECLDRLEQEAKISSHLDAQGEYYLRQNLLSYLERIRGIRCSASQVVITCGIQQSLDYICKLLGSERPAVLMEEPGYNKAVSVFRNNHMEIRTVPVDGNGVVTSRLPALPGICAIYTTPSHQFPTGVTMPIGRRYQLLEWAGRNGAYIIEDDFDSELRYYAKPIPALQSIDRDNRVIYLGTFSKALSPSVRMGYMILPPRLFACYQDKFQNYNSTAPLLNQYVIARLIESGQYDRHVRRLSNVFRKRLERFTQEFSAFKGKVKMTSNGSGQYFLLEFFRKVNQEELIQKALEQGVRVYSTMEFWQEKADCPPNTLFLGFSKIDLEDIPDCVERLKSAWSQWIV